MTGGLRRGSVTYAHAVDQPAVAPAVLPAKPHVMATSRRRWTMRKVTQSRVIPQLIVVAADQKPQIRLYPAPRPSTRRGHVQTTHGVDQPAVAPPTLPTRINLQRPAPQRRRIGRVWWIRPFTTPTPSVPPKPRIVAVTPSRRRRKTRIVVRYVVPPFVAVPGASPPVTSRTLLSGAAGATSITGLDFHTSATGSRGSSTTTGGSGLTDATGGTGSTQI